MLQNFASKAGVQADTPDCQNENANGPPGFVYVLGALTPHGVRTYVGWTLDPSRRLAQHNSGAGAKSTHGRQWTLLYVEKLDTRIAAMSREWRLKRNRRFRSELARCLMEP
ncbi:GIY-YIG nuclease family protein [Aestuariivirga sp.]|uniref:GIY-YIG nuclease family protein n=1 Tax=Aestuariivirga sp. TaxID=2650926 RepID=UPI0034576B08